MPLDTQTIPVLFDGGLSQKTAEQLVIPGKFLVLENCVRRKQGKVQKRYGFSEFSKTVVGGSTLGTGKTLLKLNNDVLQINEDKIYSYLPSSDKWVDRGTISTVTTSSSPIIRTSDSQAMPDIVTYSGLTACVWEDSRTDKAVMVSVFDEETGASILTEQVVSETGGRPKVVGYGGRIIITYIDGGQLKGAYVEVTDPTTVTEFAGGGLIDSSVIDSPYDMIAWNGEYGLLAFRGGTNTIRVAFMTNEGDLNAAILPSPIDVGFSSPTVITVARDPANQYFYVAAFNNSLTTGVYAFRSTLSAPALTTIGGLAPRNLTIAADGVGFEVYSEVPHYTGEPHLSYIYRASYTFDGTSITNTEPNAIFVRSVGLGSKAFVDGNHSYFIATHESDLQSTYFLIRSDGFIATRNFSGLGGGLTKSATGSPKSGLPRVTGAYTTSLSVKNKLVAESESILSANAGIERLNLNLNAAVFSSAQLGESAHIAGGILLNYDGNSVTEHGFSFFPENITVTKDAGDGVDDLPNGTYYYQVTYEWVDAKGQIHQSAPSIQYAVTVSGASDDRIHHSIPTLKLTLKKSPRSNVRVVVWRSPDAQVFYRLGDVENDPDADVVSFTDDNSVTATDLVKQQILYTTGGTIENIAPPASTCTVLHRNRLVLGGLDKRGYINYSREYVAGEGVAFNDLFEMPVDPASGNVTALASMDDKLIIFKKDRAYTLVGDGPLDTGAQDDYSKPQLISGDLGCENPASIASVPDGVLFKSDKGIYLLTRSLQFVYVGQDVEDFNHLSITSAVVLEDDNEVRFTTSDGSALVLNYFFSQWSTFSNYEAVSAINGVGGYLHLKSDGTVRKETPGLYLDAGGKIRMAIETSWLAFAGIQGYQRVREWALLGDFITDHYTKVKLFYDYERFSSETVYFNVDEGLELSYYGDDVVYGDAVVYGGSGSGVFQFSSKPRRQKCQAVKLRIEDIDTKVLGGGGSFNMVGLTFEVGSKNTINKQMIGNKSVGG